MSAGVVWHQSWLMLLLLLFAAVITAVCFPYSLSANSYSVTNFMKNERQFKVELWIDDDDDDSVKRGTNQCLILVVYFKRNWKQKKKKIWMLLWCVNEREQMLYLMFQIIMACAACIFRQSDQLANLFFFPFF